MCPRIAERVTSFIKGTVTDEPRCGMQGLLPGLVANLDGVLRLHLAL